MRGVTGGVAAVVLAAVCLAVPARAEVSRGAVLGYEVYVGGIKALSFETGLGLGDTSYSMEMVGRTHGLIDYMLSWRVGAETAGANPSVRPREHKVISQFRGKSRDVTVRYRPDGTVDTAILPPPEDDDREPVTAEHRRGTVDPLSAVLSLSRRLADGGDCNGTAPVFDGRRRFDAVARDMGMGEVTSTRYSSFSGPARICDVVIKRIAGYSKRASEWNRREDADKPIRTWWASVVPGAPPVPVRIESEGTFGNVVVHLVRSSATPGRPVLAAVAN